MIIKIDCELLNKQIELCDDFACIHNNPFADKFDGIANLLSEINYAVENGMELRFERVN
jgi:hypothetical protein